MSLYPKAKLRSYINYHVDVVNDGKYKSLSSITRWLTIYDIGIKFLSVVLGFTLASIIAIFIIYGLGMVFPAVLLFALGAVMGVGIWYVFSYKVVNLEHRLYRTLHTEVNTDVVEEDIRTILPQLDIKERMKIKELARVLYK